MVEGVAAASVFFHRFRDYRDPRFGIGHLILSDALT